MYMKTVSNLLELMFNEKECIGKMRCKDMHYYKDEVDASFEQIVINPVLEGIKENNITSYRNFLFEIDPEKEEWATFNNEQKLAELSRQRQYFIDKGVPTSAIIYSGNKSLHILMCLEDELPSRGIWKFTREWIQNILTEIDPNSSAVIGVRNPLNTRKDTNISPKIIQLGKRITYDELVLWLNKFPDTKPKAKLKNLDESRMDSKAIKALVEQSGKGDMRKRSKTFLEGQYDDGSWNDDFWFTANDLFGQGYEYEEVEALLESVTGHLDKMDEYQLKRIYEKEEYFKYKKPFKPTYKQKEVKKEFNPKYKW